MLPPTDKQSGTFAELRSSERPPRLLQDCVGIGQLTSFRHFSDSKQLLSLIRRLGLLEKR
jgi:hypothetical protein